MVSKAEKAHRRTRPSGQIRQDEPCSGPSHLAEYVLMMLPEHALTRHLRSPSRLLLWIMSFPASSTSLLIAVKALACSPIGTASRTRDRGVCWHTRSGSACRSDSRIRGKGRGCAHGSSIAFRSVQMPAVAVRAVGDEVRVIELPLRDPLLLPRQRAAQLTAGGVDGGENLPFIGELCGVTPTRLVNKGPALMAP